MFEEMSPEKRERGRHYIRFTVIVLLWHVLSLILYALFVGNMIRAELLYPDGRHVAIVAIYSFLLTAAFHICMAVMYARDGEARRLYLDKSRERAFSLPENCQFLWREQLYHTLILLAVQFPFMVFYGAAGFVYGEITVFEMFFAVDVALYELTHSFALGFLLNGVLSFLLFIGLRLVVLARWQKERI